MATEKTHYQTVKDGDITIEVSYNATDWWVTYKRGEDILLMTYFPLEHYPQFGPDTEDVANLEYYVEKDLHELRS